MAMNPLEVPPNQLRWSCDPECFSLYLDFGMDNHFT